MTTNVKHTLPMYYR